MYSEFINWCVSLRSCVSNSKQAQCYIFHCQRTNGDFWLLSSISLGISNQFRWATSIDFVFLQTWIFFGKWNHLINDIFKGLAFLIEKQKGPNMLLNDMSQNWRGPGQPGLFESYIPDLRIVCPSKSWNVKFLRPDRYVFRLLSSATSSVLSKVAMHRG